MKILTLTKRYGVLGIITALILGITLFVTTYCTSVPEPGGNCSDAESINYQYEGQPYRGDATVILGPAPSGVGGPWLWIMGAGTRVGNSGMVASTSGDFRPWRPWDPEPGDPAFADLGIRNFRGACLEDIIDITGGPQPVVENQDLLAVSLLVYGASYPAGEGVPEDLEGQPFYTMEVLLMQLKQRL